MTIRHKEGRFYRGDEWLISGTLQTADGLPMGLDGAIIEWALYDETGAVKITLMVGNGIEITDAPKGLILITVPSVQTETVPLGIYQDQLRVTRNNIPNTLWTGDIEVEYSPF